MNCIEFIGEDVFTNTAAMNDHYFEVELERRCLCEEILFSSEETTKKIFNLFNRADKNKERKSPDETSDIFTEYTITFSNSHMRSSGRMKWKSIGIRMEKEVIIYQRKRAIGRKCK